MRGNILLWGRQTTNSTTAMLQKANRQHFYHFFRAFLSLFRPNIEQKTPVAPSFFKIEQNKQHHRTPSKKYTTLGGLKSFLPRIKQMQCPKMHFESISQRPKRGRKRHFWPKNGPLGPEITLNSRGRRILSREIRQYHLFGLIC